MGKLCDDLWVEILGRLSSEKDLVPCMSVSRLWHRIASDIWVRRFWVQNPPLAISFSSFQANIKYISLYKSMADNVESTSARGRRSNCDTTYRSYSFRYFDHDEHDEYLHGCNGLLLLLKSGTNQFYVYNPITKQQVPVPKACVHQNYEHCCAALAFDPSESPHHYRVVRIDYTESLSSTSNFAMLDIFSSESRQWIRQRMQLDPEFTEGFEQKELCRQFFYLRDKLYSLAMYKSWKILCIDLKSFEASALELPIPKDGFLGCLGVSMDLLCYINRMPFSGADVELVVWYYDDRCKSSEWTRKYSVSWFYNSPFHNAKPYAICPSSGLLFYGNNKIIRCRNLKSGKSEFVYKAISWDRPYWEAGYAGVIVPDYFWVLRACLVPLYQLGNKAVVPEREGIEILDAEAPSKEQKDADDKVYCDRSTEPLPPLIYPSEIAHDMYCVSLSRD